MVMPPGAIVSNAVVGDLVFTYRYNNKNLLCTKKVPGADSVKYYYNNRNLLMLTQDGNMRAESPNKYFGIDYDPLGRKWATGLISTTHPVDDAMYNWYFWTKNLTYDYYIPNTNLLAGTNTASLGAINTALGDRSMMFRSIQYNAKGERDWGCSEYLRFHNCEDYLFNTDGTLKSATKYNNGANGYQVFYSQLYAYDHSRRLKTTRQQLWGPNGTGTNFFAPIVELSAITYNHKDQVTEKNIGRRTDISGAKALQSIDYQYNQRGWLSGINQMPVSMHNAILRTRNGQQVLDIDPNPTYNIASGEGSVDLFSESIRYDAPDANFAAVTPQYNGNISQVMWQVAGKERQAYTYSYDPIDRMTAGVYTDVHDEYIAELAATIGQPYDPTFERDNKYNETLTYDVRGNITKLSRNGMYTLTQNNGGYLKGTFGQIDSLQYTYNNKNQITTIVDKAPAANRYKGFNYYDYYVEAYAYDKNGNLSKDKNKGIDTIIYNYMNLPERIEFVYNRRIEFIYDATGMKLRKSVSFPSDPFNLNSARYTTTTDYMDGFEYEDDKIQRIAHTEGYISRREKRTTESAEFVGMGGLVWQYNYVLRDHLGNTRVTFADTTGNGLIDPTIEIAQINHYYPFGLNMDGNWNGASPNVKNKYQYNNKELQTDFGLNWNDYGARMYDAAIGRFTTADPMADFRSWVSPYQYVQNNPINRIDPTGMLDGKGADGMTNEEWMKASNPANNGSQAASTAYSGLNHAKTNYENQKAENEYAAAHGGATRAVTADDVNNGASLEITRGTSVKDEKGNDYGGTCECGCPGKPDCNTLNPATLGKNLAGMTYPGGDNPMKYNGLPDYSYNPGYKNLFEYPAIGHDRAYDILKIKGLGGLMIDTRAIGADWTFVKQELQIAIHCWIFPYGKATDPLKAGALGIGLGLLSLPKTIITYLNPVTANIAAMWGNLTNSTTNNIPSK